tara:strand:+ start:3297 stop:4070 length:774 start_codon:yes stop_codon:yes gene_type:complete
MNTPLKVLPLADYYEDDKDADKYPSLLPRIARNRGFNLVLLGTTGSGKTNLVNNLLLSKYMWGSKKKEEKGAFEEVYFFSPSVNLDDSCRFFREHFITFDEYSDEALEEILAKQREYKQKEMPRILIVLDDMVGALSKSSSKLINRFSSRYRHYNANLIFSTQSLRGGLSPIIRVNTTDMIIFKVPNLKEIEKIDEEYGGMFRSRFLTMYLDATKEPYSFLYLRLRTNPPQAWKNFDTQYEYKSMPIMNLKDVEAEL